jgi:uncharacterized protein (UPF0332 family)
VNDEDALLLVRYRLEQAETTLADTRFLLDSGRSAQSVINRAYHAMFYAALALLQRDNVTPTKHAGVISLFDTGYVLKGTFPRDLSKDFHKAFELRQVSDYRITDPPSIEKAAALLDKAARFVGAIPNHLQKPTDAPAE